MNDFDIDSFVINSSTEVTVHLPNTSFRVMKSKHEEIKGRPEYFIIYRQKKWWLLHPDVARQVSGVFRAYLIEAVDSDGRYFLIPITIPFSGYTTSWFESWVEVISIALKRWVRTTKSEEEKAMIPTIIKNNTVPKWPGYPHQDWVRMGFKGRIITSINHPALTDCPNREYDRNIVVEE